VGYEDVNDAARLSQDPTFGLIGSRKIWERGAALTSRLQSFETEVLTQEENLEFQNIGETCAFGNHAQPCGRRRDRRSSIGAADPDTSLKLGQVLNEPGKYVLTTDLTDCFAVGGAVIVIVTDNIDFNLNGHSIIGDPEVPIPISLADGISNVFIHNGTVFGQGVGITLINDSNITISGISFPGNTMNFLNHFDISIGGGNNLRITDNTFQGSFPAGGAVGAVSVSNSVFSRNVITGGFFKPYDGFFLLESSSIMSHK
jgi:hypothetical protein